MKPMISLLTALCALPLFACNGGKAPSTAPAQAKSEVRQDTITVFTLPEIPPMMTAPELRADFLVRHYWDNVNFADTNYIHHPAVTEQAWVDFCNVLNHVPLKTAQEAMRSAIERASVNKKVFDYITDLADKYLYDPNSPMRNEEFYIPVLETMIASQILDKVEKIRPTARLELAKKNRIGTKALDFTYTLASGAQGSLYQIKTEYVLLFINNPGCHACSETTRELNSALNVNGLLNEKRLTVLSLYPDEELKEWRKHLNEFPQKWINAYDKELIIKERQLYDLKAIPTLYLLDKEKKVLLKDTTVKAIEEYLSIYK